MDKRYLVEQLGLRLRAVASHAAKVADENRTEAKTGAARAVNLAKATGLRSASALAALDALEQFRVKPMQRGEPIGLGALVEIESETGGKTLFVAPAGAGEELTGPDGDGIFQVVTPGSPLGKALLGKKVGDELEVTLQGDITEWKITYAA